MSNLSPAAQAVFDAANAAYWDVETMCPNDANVIAAAALCAAVEQTIRPDPLMGVDTIIYARDILAIAAELEAIQ